MTHLKVIEKDPTSLLKRFSLQGQAEKMELQMLDDKFVLGELAILGQWTTFYAQPNAGKTLIILWLLIKAIEKGEINPDNVFYVNADDNYRGLVEKTKLSEKAGFHMLAPNINGFKSALLIPILQQYMATNTAKGVIIILDTLKKFTNLMNKTESAAFGTIAGEFRQQGGTIISLAHVNKRKDDEGKSVHAGTSDIKDDSDCVYILEVQEKPSNDINQVIRHVMFLNDKSRGDVAMKAVYEYTKTTGEGYQSLFNSIRHVSKKEAKQIKEANRMSELLAKNKEIIDTITSVINEGINKKTELTNEVHERCDESRKKIRNVLKNHTGNSLLSGNRWNYRTITKNGREYYLLHGQDGK